MFVVPSTLLQPTMTDMNERFVAVIWLKMLSSWSSNRRVMKVEVLYWSYVHGVQLNVFSAFNPSLRGSGQPQRSSCWLWCWCSQTKHIYTGCFILKMDWIFHHSCAWFPVWLNLLCAAWAPVKIDSIHVFTKYNNRHSVEPLLGS